MDAPPSGGAGPRGGRGDGGARRWRERGEGPAGAGAPYLGRPGAREGFVIAAFAPPPVLKAPLLSAGVLCACRTLGSCL